MLVPYRIFLKPEKFKQWLIEQLSRKNFSEFFESKKEEQAHLDILFAVLSRDTQKLEIIYRKAITSLEKDLSGEEGKYALQVFKWLFTRVCQEVIEDEKWLKPHRGPMQN